MDSICIFGMIIVMALMGIAAIFDESE